MESVEEIKESIKNMEKTVEKKYESLENKINTLTKCIKEKDCIIVKLTDKLQSKTEKNLRKFCKSGEKSLCYRKDQIGL